MIHKQNGLMLEDLKEKNTVINFWADWCPPCIKEIPELNALYEENKDELNVYLFHFDELAGAELDEQLIRFNARIPSLLTIPYQIFGIDIPETLPVTVIIDRDLNVKEVLRGPQTKESIIQRLELIN
jgi:thiol-disulfide isomerase/thioredoxin